MRKKEIIRKHQKKNNKNANLFQKKVEEKDKLIAELRDELEKVKKNLQKEKNKSDLTEFATKEVNNSVNNSELEQLKQQL